MPRVYLILDENPYFESCARIRGIKTRSLIRRLIKVIEEDQLISSVLDDADCITEKQRYEHGRSNQADSTQKANREATASSKAHSNQRGRAHSGVAEVRQRDAIGQRIRSTGG